MNQMFVEAFLYWAFSSASSSANNYTYTLYTIEMQKDEVIKEIYIQAGIYSEAG
jgi:hypothetical protein